MNLNMNRLLGILKFKISRILNPKQAKIYDYLIVENIILRKKVEEQALLKTNKRKKRKGKKRKKKR